jgi:hypothetical protein
VSRWWIAIVLYGVLNAAAYSCLLPLWEGFDEGYHYGYTQSLSTTLRFPVLGHTALSREIWRAYQLAPVSHYLQPFTKAPLNFTDYFALSQEERRQRRHELETIPDNYKFEPQMDKPNYEVNQSPLPYVWMAAIDRVLSGWPLPTRVLWLRLIGSMAAVLMLAHAARLLARELALPDLYARAALFCVFSSQMLYATLCHVCNDSLAVPLMAYLLYASIRAHRNGSGRDWFMPGLALTGALLTKAYFLFLIPLPLGLLAWALWRKNAPRAAAAFFFLPLVLLAAPWYERNLILYRNLSGTVESTSGLGLQQLLSAAASLPWPASIDYITHSSLWTGNNSFTTFSSATLNAMLLLLALGVILCARARLRAAEWLTMAAVVLFSAGLALISVTFYASSRGAAIAAVPWYSQVLLLPVLLLAFVGMERTQPWGRILLALTVPLWTYVIIATYLAKLVPLYGGYSGSRAHIGELWRWYLEQGQQRDAILSTVCLAHPAILWALIGTITGLGVVLAGRLMAEAARPA